MQAKTLWLGALMVTMAAAGPARGTEWFVGLKGHDAQAGNSAAAAFATMERACKAARPGDTITVLDGEYDGHTAWKLTASGAPAGPVTYRAEHPGKVLIRITAPLTAYQDVLTVDANYVVIDGFDGATTSNGSGVWINGRHDVTVQRCTMHDCGGSGIGTQMSDFLTIQDNVVYRNAFTNPYQCSGISVYHPVAAGLAEGRVTLDEASSAAGPVRIFVMRNRSWGNQNKVGEGGRQVSKATDGNGIIIDDFANRWQNDFPNDGRWPRALVGQKLPAYEHGATVQGNVCFGNGGRGIHVLNSPHVRVRHNTLYENCQNQLDGTWQGDLSAQASDDYCAEFNVVYAGDWGAGRQPVMLANPYKNEKMHAVFAHNLVWMAGGVHHADRPWVYVPTPGYATVTDVVEQDPEFEQASVDPERANLQVKAGSPAATQPPATQPGPAYLEGEPQSGRRTWGAYGR